LIGREIIIDEAHSSQSGKIAACFGVGGSGSVF
jgi:hypothetical protein